MASSQERIIGCVSEHPERRARKMQRLRSFFSGFIGKGRKREDEQRAINGLLLSGFRAGRIEISL
jgi:hypothetical protein